MEIRRMAPILVAGLVAACTPAPASAPPPTPTVVPPTATVQPDAATSPPPTVAPTPVPSTATVTSPPPTMVPSTETFETDTDQDSSSGMEADRMNIEVGDDVLTATLVENSSVDALKEALSEGPITVDMRDYGNMEKVGSLGMELPRNDEQITAEAGDIILYQGSAFVIYYAPNSWDFTRLGKIDNVSAEELREILGEGDVTVTLSLPQE